MSEQMYDRDFLYDALIRRDPAWDGRAFVGVTTTGVFCRLTCPARKPKKENCQFFTSVSGCLDAGFRPCRRCHPLAPEAEANAAVKTLMDQLNAEPGKRWRETDISAAGFDPSAVRKIFKRHFGCTFLELARRTRLRAGLETLSNGEPVIEAQLEAGFESASSFRMAFSKLLGLRPSDFTAPALLQADWIDTPIGSMVCVSDDRFVHLLEFSERKALPRELKKLYTQSKGQIGFGRPAPTKQAAEQLEKYFSGHSAGFNVPLALHGSEFTKTVWRKLQAIPAGETRSYSQIAAEIGRPDSTRAVARANGANQIAIIIPCHRVIGADGSLTGYGGGLWRKQKLIALEAQYANKK